MPRPYLELRIFLCDHDEPSSAGKDLGIGLECGREELVLIAECLEEVEFDTSEARDRHHDRGRALAKHIRSEILANLPEEEMV